MARSLRRKVKHSMGRKVAAGLAALVLSTGPATALTVFDPSVFAQVVSVYNTTKEALKTATDTLNNIIGLYNEISGWINFAETIVKDPEKFVTNTVQCLFSFNIGPLNPRNISLCDTAKEVERNLTLYDPSTGGAATTVTPQQQQQVKANRQAVLQQSSLRAVALGTHNRNTAPDTAQAILDLQIAASTATTLVPINRVTMQASVIQAKELAAIRQILANMAEMQGAQQLNQTPVIYKNIVQVNVGP